MIRIGAVSYLNTKPLIEGITNHFPDAELELDYPSRLADRLREGTLDVALIPSFEAFQCRDYRVVSDACIACEGPVWSVKLLSRVPMDQIRSLSLDEGSRTSAALSRILLERKFGVRPQLARWSVESQLNQVSTDAVLMIGDRAMVDDFPGWNHVWDLGSVWRDWCSLPFVFAMWVARSTEVCELVEAGLGQSRDDGLARLPQIAQREASRYGLSTKRCLSYLGENLQFYLGPRQRAALNRFQTLAQDAGLAPSDSELIYHGCQIA